MLIFRLLPVSLLLAVSAVSAAAQSSPEKNPSVVPSTDIGQQSSSADLASPITPELNPLRPLDGMGIEEYRPRSNQFGSSWGPPPVAKNRGTELAELLPPAPESLPPNRVLGADGLQPEDTLCLTMRTYKVARDDRRSDSTHAVGYTTCQPATRFHVHTADERVFPAKP
jgi:hypothetical protein